jgi:hypothetical protein
MEYLHGLGLTYVLTTSTPEWGRLTLFEIVRYKDYEMDLMFQN